MSREEFRRIRAIYEKRQDPAIAGRYGCHQPGELYGVRRRQEESQALLRRHCPAGLNGLRILDIGCGRGKRLAELAEWGADPAKLTGIDLMERFIREAARSFPASRWLVASGDTLPFGDASFDLVTQAMMLSSVLDGDMRRRLAAEIWRVVKPGGLILWYDMRYANPWNPDVRPVNLKELARLFPRPPVETLTLTLLPPLARRLAGHSHKLCRLLERLPWLRSHRLALFRKDSR